MDKILIYLDQFQSAQLELFQKYYVPFSIMVESKVFEQRGAAITLHFDNEGVLRTIARGDVLYSYGVDFKNTNQKVGA